MTSKIVDFSSDAPIDVDLSVEWMDGSGPSEPLVQVHALDEHTYVLRQSLKTHYEGPFIFLLLGNTGALMIDSGATETWPLRETVDGIIADWLVTHPNPTYSLTVAHSHSHGDHTAGDVQFADRPNTSIVPANLEGVQGFFGFTNWPNETVNFDLGGRVVSVIAGPGHEEAATVFYDPWTGILFTGDTVYPGRLYVPDMPAYIATLERVITFMAAVPVSYLMGCHIEMSSTPGEDHPLGSLSHPGEAPMPMLPGQLFMLHERATAIAGTPGVHTYDDVIIYNGKAIVDGYLGR
ncbi:MAG: Metallo-beta-lactamase superfamily protein [Leifsonia sp.]|nr:Metallo-beta-lactamase superfamily protein [Leifsonia sp.]